MVTVEGDITTATSGYILHGVNLQGKMGAGVAKAIADKWPVVKEVYMEKLSRASLGDISVAVVSDGLAVINCHTQRYYGRDGRKYASYDAADEAFSNAATWIMGQRSVSGAIGLPQIHFPQIGCGLAGGDWNIMSAIIRAHFPDHLFDRWLWVLP